VESTRQPKDWYAIVLRRNPEINLVIDRSLTRAWIIARIRFPELDSEDLSFRTVPEKEIDGL
jgi:hypothetical protein